MGRKILQITPQLLIDLLSPRGNVRYETRRMPADARVVGVRHDLLLDPLSTLSICIESNEWVDTEAICYEDFQLDISAFDPRGCLTDGHVKCGIALSCACGAVRYNADGTPVNLEDGQYVYASKYAWEYSAKKIRWWKNEVVKQLMQEAREPSITPNVAEAVPASETAYQAWAKQWNEVYDANEKELTAAVNEQAQLLADASPRVEPTSLEDRCAAIKARLDAKRATRKGGYDSDVVE